MVILDWLLCKHQPIAFQVAFEMGILASLFENIHEWANCRIIICSNIPENKIWKDWTEKYLVKKTKNKTKR